MRPRSHYPWAIAGASLFGLFGALVVLVGILYIAGASLHFDISSRALMGFGVILAGMLMNLIALAVRLLIDIEAALTERTEPNT